jgi:metacaspase-1
MARKALLIGIDDYQSVSSLRGCGNDVSNLFDVLSNFAGFTSNDVRAVANDRATKAAIETRIEWLVAGAKPGDTLVLHVSSHGSQVRDRDGDDLGDGLDEVLCPFDMSFDGNYITDDYLDEKLVVPDGVVLEVILDACHSGTGSVQTGFPGAAPVDPDPNRTSRFVQPPVDIAVRHVGQGLPTRRLLRGRSPARTVLWSACAEFQTAADARIDGVFNGAFTFYFCKHLRESNASLSRAELLRRVRSSLSRAGFSQVPELSVEGTLGALPPFRSV